MKAFSRSMLLLAALFALASPLSAQPAKYVEGTHYQTLDKPVRTVDPNKIEVTEVFWYGCQHCYAFEPLLESWVPRLPDDVVFVRSPGMWNQMMETHAQIYYVAEALGVLDEVHADVFDAIHQRRNYLDTPEKVKEFFVSRGVSAEDFDKTWGSFSMNSKVKQAGARMREYRASGVPALVVNGKYLISGASTQAEMLQIADFLIQKERSES